MGRGRVGERTTGGNPTTTVVTSSAGHPLAAWGRGVNRRPPCCRHCHRRQKFWQRLPPRWGVSCPPPSGPSRPAGCRSSLSMSPTAVNGGGMGAFGAWSYAGWRRKFHAVVLIRQVLIQPGMDDGGKRSSVTLAGVCPNIFSNIGEIWKDIAMYWYCFAGVQYCNICSDFILQ
jgi:hypothetical protein